MPGRRKTIVATAVFAAVWIAAVVFGFRSLGWYENTPGTIGHTPESWPAASHIPRPKDKATLVMFAHPHCPCTRASIGELAEVMARVPNKISACVVFLKPEGAAPDWGDTDLRHSAERIPGVTIVSDVDGAEARRFGAETSGYTLLFDSNGHRLFEGGITASRGHAGDNVGKSAIVSLLNDQTVEHARTHVFGCSLIDPQRMPNGARCPKQATN